MAVSERAGRRPAIHARHKIPPLARRRLDAGQVEQGRKEIHRLDRLGDDGGCPSWNAHDRRHVEELSVERMAVVAARVVRKHLLRSPS